MAKDITIEIEKPRLWLLLGILFVITFMDMQLTFSSPIAFGDEPFHVYMGKYIAQNVEYPKYIPAAETGTQKPGYHKPPLWNMLQAGFYLLFGFSESIIKFLNPFIVFVTGLASYLLFKKVFNENIALLATIIMLTVPNYVTYSVLFYVDTLFVMFFTLAIASMMVTLKTKEMKYVILTSIFSAFAILTKTPAYTLIPFFGLCFLYQLYTEKNLMQNIKTYGPIAIILALIIGPYFLRNIVNYGTPDCNMPVFGGEGCSWQIEYKPEQNFAGDVQKAGTGADIIRMGLDSFIEFAYGIPWFVPILFFAGLYIVLKSGKASHIPIIFVLLTFLIILNQIMKGRAEDANRYLLGLVPVVALSGAIYLDSIVEFVNKHRERYSKYVALVIIIFVLILSFTNLNGKLTVMKNVKAFSSLFFKSCEYVKHNLPENASLFVLYAAPTIYNCERKASWEVPDKADIVLGSNVTHVLDRLQANGFTHIIVQKFAISSGAYSQTYPVSFVNFLKDRPQTFVNVYEDGPSVDTCLSGGGCDGSIIYEINYSSIQNRTL